MSAHRYGWRPQSPDHRDFRFTAPEPFLASLPSRVDLRPSCPPVYDQGRIGACTANAIASALQFCQRIEGVPDFTPSRLFIYYNERDMEGTVTRDAGAMIRDGIKVVSSIGAPAEKYWSYDDTPADPVSGVFRKDAKAATRPTCFAWRHAKDADAIAYLAVAQNLDQMRGCLAQGFPFVFGFAVYEGFESQAVAATGVVNMPLATEKSLGGHAVLCVGYDDATQRFIVRNSWGPSWGQSGYFTIPYAYLLDPSLASDFWSIRFV